ncbi:MAG: hypothetical protein WAQ08_15940 [Aquabacterium sp.]|uniref:hypothetical protein n=1 Tax=Aquabacterium sp. TaxID=1872578 RepID=UPI003BAE35B5
MNFNPYSEHLKVCASVRDVINQALLGAALQMEREARGLRRRVVLDGSDRERAAMPERCAQGRS